MKSITVNINIIKYLILIFITGIAPHMACADPVQRVARLSYMNGIVSFLPAGMKQWIKVTLNRPLIIGDQLWSDIDSRVELQLGTAAIRMGEQTNLKILNLNNKISQFKLTNGTVVLSIRRVISNQRYEIDTPNLAFTTQKSGYYRIDVNSKSKVTVVTIRKGLGEVYGKNATLKIKAGQSCRFTGTNLKGYQCFASGPTDDLDRWSLERDQSAMKTITTKYVSPSTIGYEDLELHGKWKVVKKYGRVWIPNQVPSNWAPYRMGHWIWLDQWGWTWVDEQPWGFAPFHYGRWIYIEDRWSWVPGPIEIQPIYAPALVVFIGGNHSRLELAGGMPGIAWFPLAPGEIYIPPYQVSRDYFIQVNTSNTIINKTYVTNVYNNRNINIIYQNIVTNGVSAVPTSSFIQSEPVNNIMVQVPSETLVNAPKSQVATVVPSPTSVLGGNEAASTKPSKEVIDESAIIKTEPPPESVPFTEQQKLLTKDPGVPLTTEEVEKLTTDEKKTPEVQQQTPEVQQQTPEEQQSAPEVQQQTPEVQQQTPEEQQSAPEVQQQTPEVQQQTPEVQQQQPPEEQQSAPEVQQQTPEVQQQTPEVQQQTPEVQQQTPEVQQQTPEVQQQPPEEQQSAPEVQQQTPEEQQSAPEVQQQTPEEQQPINQQ